MANTQTMEKGQGQQSVNQWWHDLGPRGTLSKTVQALPLKVFGPVKKCRLPLDGGRTEVIHSHQLGVAYPGQQKELSTKGFEQLRPGSCDELQGHRSVPYPVKGQVGSAHATAAQHAV
jgi:hypothetical protein